ncbi:unnamed protein product [Nezara viridula]|uniref:Uncharacterized protein n=1 Tax=Nezara viridula TaxID=85310 RepID=A0A9P0HBV9_NEZVI|nr:unnamed protein product [Nezara viridula]
MRNKEVLVAVNRNHGWHFGFQIKMTFLLQTMMTNPPVIHFLGYLIIDRHLFVKFISDTVTYLVVLIQFKTSSYSRTPVNATNEVFD